MWRSLALSGAIALLAATMATAQGTAGGRRVGRGQGPGGAGGFGAGFGGKTPTALRAIPAESTAAKVKDPNWKAPKTAWGHPDLEGRLDERRHAQRSDEPRAAIRDARVADRGGVPAGARQVTKDREIARSTRKRFSGTSSVCARSATPRSSWIRRTVRCRR